MKDKKQCRHGSYQLTGKNYFKCQFCGKEFTVEEVDRLIYGENKKSDKIKSIQVS